MDCDTTGVEPDFALVKFKKLAGGGYFKIVNQSVPAALATLGYTEHEVQDIVAYVSGTNTLLAAPHINRAKLLQAGLTKAELDKVEDALPSVFDLGSAFAPWVIGDRGLRASRRARLRRQAERAEASPCSSIWASPPRRSKRRATSSSVT